MNKKENGISLQHNPSVTGKASTVGITLVALVVTIVVLLILAGITIVYVFGDNGVFGQASEAKLKTDIANWQERLEMAKSPVFIEGLGIFNPNKYFEYIESQGIINDKDTDVINNGDGTYDVTVKPGYVFLVTLIPTPENPTDAEIEYIGQAGKLPPRIKNIKVIGKTGASLDIEVEVTRLEEGKLSYYYKEVEEPESAYKEVKKDVTDLTATIGNLSEGKIYHIKVVAKNEKGEDELVVKEALQQLVKTIVLDKTTSIVKPNNTLQLNATILPENAENKTLEWSSSNETVAIVDNNGLVTAKENGNTRITVKATDGSEVQATCDITVKIPVESITLNKTNATIYEQGVSMQLTATILPETATNKMITWQSSNTDVVTVDQNGLVTKISNGTATITAISNDDTSKKAICSILVSEETDWNLMNVMAKVVSDSSSFTSNTGTGTITVSGVKYVIKLGDIFKVRYNGTIKRVRLIGFKHDDLVDKGAYGGNNIKAGMSFEFVDYMIGSEAKQMNSTDTNAGGWASTQLRKELNGYSSNAEIQNSQIGGLGANLSNKSYIKQVKKKYIPTFNRDSVSISNDYLWLLACSEIYELPTTVSGTYAKPITTEGERYRYYKTINPVYGTECPSLSRVENELSTTQYSWWMRSPSNGTTSSFCFYYAGTYAVGGAGATNKFKVVPGFCI